MEQAQYWMLMKRRQFLKSHFQVSLSDSWEEKAFAEDAGFIWPPRSYTCSFCRREFRSAQALGGHMNVHRRDRAKLKQSLSLSPNNEVVPHQNLNPIPLKSFPHRADHELGRSTFSASRVSANLSKNFCQEELFGSNSSSKTTVNNVISSSYGDDEAEAINCKRRKIDVSTLPFLVVGVKPGVAGSMEELDLELRLGVQPKVK